MPSLIVRVPGQSPIEVPFDGYELKIGRAPDCEVVVDEHEISRNHAVITRDAQGFEIEDAGSRNGVFVNDERIERKRIGPRDRIRLGSSVELELRAREADEDDEDEEAKAPRGGGRSAGRAGRGGAGRGSRRARGGGGGPFPFLREVVFALRAEELGGRGAVHVLRSRVTTVGRDSSAGLQIEDDSLSRLHARLDRDGGTLTVSDLKSRNGVNVNGEPVLRAALEAGDLVQFGNVAFEVEREERLAWGRVWFSLGAIAALVAVVWGAMAINDTLSEHSAIAAEKDRLHRQALSSVEKGIAAFQRDEPDYARGYLLYAADLLLLTGLAPAGTSMSKPEEVFRNIARELPADERGFDFAKALDPTTVTAARTRLEGLSNHDYVERQTKSIAIELGLDEGVPQGFIDEVWSFVDQFTRYPGQIQSWLNRSPRIHPTLKMLLADAHLPEVFCYVAWVESQLDPQARSPVGAVGLWQFMVPTGRDYGLRIDQGGVDERTDPVRSTQAATRYIGSLLRRFGREQFMCALASYNRGPGAVWRAMEKIPDPMMESSKKYWYLVENGLLPKETSEYVPKIFAVRIIAEDPERFGMHRP
jgi:pSer/pThr/pTyr-binding forkhead associated (FHA) protein